MRGACAVDHNIVPYTLTWCCVELGVVTAGHEVSRRFRHDTSGHHEKRREVSSSLTTHRERSRRVANGGPTMSELVEPSLFYVERQRK